MGRTVRGTAVVRPTFAAELLRAWETLTVHEAVGLALRDHRRRVGMTQRAYASVRGWSKTHQYRLESEAEGLRLGQIVQALEGTGFELALRQVGASDVDRTPDGLEDEDPSFVAPQHWAVTELVARDGQQRRFPPTRQVRRTTTLGPDWWWRRHSTNALARRPEWTTGM